MLFPIAGHDPLYQMRVGEIRRGAKVVCLGSMEHAASVWIGRSAFFRNRHPTWHQTPCRPTTFHRKMPFSDRGRR